jgi:hypothetical protein
MSEFMGDAIILSGETGTKLKSSILRARASMDDFDRIWNDVEWQKACARYSYYVDNMSVRILRPSILIKPK